MLERTPPRKRASMGEVADLAGVTKSSVSRVLSNHPDVSPGMRARVMTAVAKLDYKPNLLAQGLRRRESLSIGFVIGDISNPLLAQIVMGAETALREAGYSMLLTNSEGDPELDAAHVRLFEQRRVDGLILSTASERHEPTYEALRDADLPIVFVDREMPRALGASCVLSDHRAGMSAAVRHLLDLGHRRIGVVLGQPVRPCTERLRALEEVFAERGLPATYDVVEGRFAAEHGETAARALLDSAEPPTVIIAAGNQLVIGALRVLAERGLELPRDLSFVGCDDVDVTELYDPPIATVRRDIFRLGRVAAELLLRRLSGEDEPAKIDLPTEFVPRSSTGPPRT